MNRLLPFCELNSGYILITEEFQIINNHPISEEIIKAVTSDHFLSHHPHIKHKVCFWIKALIRLMWKAVQ